MLDMNDLRVGVRFVLDSDPYEVLSANHLKMQQRRPVMQTRMRNLRTGQVFERNFHQGDTFAEAEILQKTATFLFVHRDGYTFQEKGNPHKRFTLSSQRLGDDRRYLRPNLDVTVLYFNDELLTVQLPIKLDLKVVEAPPSVRGNTAQGGTKMVKVETGVLVSTPLFIEEGDVIRINTESGQYVERVTKRS